MKSVLIALAALVTTSVFAATNETTTTTTTTPSHTSFTRPNLFKGNFQVGGGLSYTTTPSSEQYSNLYPNFAYFIEDKISLGMRLSYSESTYSSGSSNSIGFGPNATYYFGPFNQVAPFFSMGLDYSEVRSRTTGYDDSTYSDVYMTPALGVQYFFTNELSFGMAFESSFQTQTSSGQKQTRATNSLQGSFGYYF